ncbi:hypothetical protein [Iningainema tapete]|uniref:Uncharacterized protein n=1 Tax=Iningainema tapete BLCC-T55 TaxID=2748662 RepID=A0A8J6XK81_9CYAN|nr:hypothetical protein [Iningainema tapete]MBD2777669.1 hypothetical protein [Iningainema tapete BLCC-T55]
MIDRINDIAWQAHQGSVAAIIQILNEQLANSGVRTRAIFDRGVLQLLCEAHTVDKLEKSILVKQIQQILESIAPRNIRRVNINSRVVREQQLLWLEEINRDPDNLLWSQEITLIQPNFFKQLVQDFQESKTEFGKQNLLKSYRRYEVFNKNNFKTAPRKRISELASLCIFLLLIFGGVYALIGYKLKNPMQSLEVIKSLTPADTNPKKIELSPVATRLRVYTPESQDFFAAAVRIANYNTITGKTAKTSAQWLDLAARWQRASELMRAVPPTHSRYQEAQIRTKLYKIYSEAAQKEAKKSPSFL